MMMTMTSYPQSKFFCLMRVLICGEGASGLQAHSTCIITLQTFRWTKLHSQEKTSESSQYLAVK